jgi:predicted DNA-binding transcriptional regulator YafY
MRADRLVAALLILQARGRVTAAELAEELEVSERTARRDLEALSMAGIPVYPQVGRGGGWSLVGGARTDLSGLTAAEARTLFMVAGPSAAATPQVKAALRKLVRALPEPFRAEAEAAASAVVLDPTHWDRTDAPPPVHLEALQKAVVDGFRVRLRYAGRDRPESERIVHPLGLVKKASVWYLVGGTDAGLRTFRLSRVRAVTVTDEPVERPAGFDLAETWRSVVDTVDERRAGFRVTARARAETARWLRGAFGSRATIRGGTDDGRIEVELRSWSSRSIAGELAAFGADVEVIDPPEVRAELGRLGSELGELYGSTSPARGPVGRSGPRPGSDPRSRARPG